MPSASHSAINAALSVASIVQPTGTGISRIQDLSGSDLNTKINSTSNQVSFPAGTFTWNDFSYPASQTSQANHGRGLNITNATGLLGSGVGSTILQMNAGSTTKSADMTVANIDMHYIYANSQVKLIQDMTIQGMSIGDVTKKADGSAATNGTGDEAPSNASPYIYNGLYIAQIDGLVVRRVKLSNIPGSDHVNPGESGYVDWYQGGSSTWDTVELDGGSSISGGTGATGFLINNLASSSSLTFTNCYVHGLKYSCAWSFYKAPGNHTLTGCTFDQCRALLNFEMNSNSCVVAVNQCRFGTQSVGRHITMGSTVGSVKLTINDPLDLNGNPLTNLIIGIDGYYSPNLQAQSDIHVYVGGVDRTSTIVTWTT